MDFKNRYRRECLLSGTSPLHVIEAYLSDFTLNFKFFRIPISEWGPIILTLRNDETLKKIIINIDFSDHTIDNPTHKQKLQKLPLLVESLASQLKQNSSLTEIQLIGLPFSSSDVQVLAQGIRKSSSLQHLSLKQCKIGDYGAQLLSEAVQGKPSIVWLDLTSCSLTSKSGEALFDVIHHQTVSRENAVWKASLRKETPVLDLMGGLRRLTLNDNDLGDAVKHLASALLEDKWIKAIDLQFCHMDDASLHSLIQAATKNSSLVLLDVRNNCNLTESLVEKLEEVLKNNNLNTSGPLKFKSIEMEKTQAPTTIRQSRFASVASASEGCKKAVTKIPAEKISFRVPPKVASRTILTKTSFSENLKPPNSANETMIPQFPNNNSEKETREDELARERQMRLDAERQVIKMYNEMESAWARIAKLEKKVKQLKKKNGSRPDKRSFVDVSPAVEQPGIWIDSPTLENFQLCLGQLRGILRELKSTNILDAKPENRQESEVKVILSTLHSAIRELSSRVNYSPPENQQLDNFTPQSHPERQQYSSDTRAQMKNPPEEDNFRAMQTDHSHELQKSNRAASVPLPASIESNLPKFEWKKAATTHRNLTSTPLSEALAPKLDELRRVPTFTQEQTSAISKQQLLAELSNEKKSTYAAPERKSPLFTAPVSSSSSDRPESYGSQELSTKNKSSNRSNQGSRLDSLKNLKGDLEGLLHQFRHQEDPSFNLHNSILSTNTATYSEDFQSSTVRSTTKKASEKSSKAEKAKSSSRSSSTLNLSSIVDLLGDFSVGDIGSSTLTPP